MKQTLVRAYEHMRFTLPLIFSNLLNITGSFISMYLIAKLGRNELSAGALIYTVYSIYMTVILSFLIPVSIMVGRAFGAKEFAKVGTISLSGLILVTMLAIPCILFMLNLYPLLILLHQPTEVSHLVADYFHALSYSVLPFLYLMVLTQVVIGVSRPSVPMIAVALGLPIGLLLTYGMLFGKLAMPALGIVGAAYASVITAYLSLSGFIIYLYFNKYYDQFKNFSLNRQIFSTLLSILNFGWPIAIQRGAEILAFSVLTFMMGLLGSYVLAAQQIILQFTMIAMMVAFSFTQASGVLVGQAYGKNDLWQAQRDSYISISLGTLIAFVIGLIFLIFPRTLMSMFIDVNNPAYDNTIQLTTTLFRISSLVLVFDSIRNIAIGALRGFYDMQYPMFIGVLACWLIGVPSAYLFGFIFHKGAAGILFGFTFSIAVCALVLLRRIQGKCTKNVALKAVTVYN